jgi:GNAT superfamily N-acetyltransferase
LAYVDGKAVGWSSVGPRGDYGLIAHSAVIKPVDDKPVWCVVCFFIDRAYRGRKVATTLLRAAVEFAGAHGALAVEGYPVKTEGASGKVKAPFCGTDTLFLAAGFQEIAMTGAKSGGNPRVVMRWDVG